MDLPLCLEDQVALEVILLLPSVAQLLPHKVVEDVEKEELTM